MIQNYLAIRKQRTKINDSYSPWSDIHFGVLQGSILGPLLLNIFLSDLFLIVKDDNMASHNGDKLNFDKHVKILCNKANKKLRPLARATPYRSDEKKKILINSFFKARFNTYMGVTQP